MTLAIRNKKEIGLTVSSVLRLAWLLETGRTCVCVRENGEVRGQEGTEGNLFPLLRGCFPVALGDEGN